MRSVSRFDVFRFALGLSLGFHAAAAQQTSPATIGSPVTDTSVFAAVPLPPANTIRGISGAPGPDYWQQQVDYSMAVTLDTARKRLVTEETIHYINHSPDTLRF